jgi:protein-tyrosine-phosphatase
MAAALLQQAADDAGVAVQVSSAGFLFDGHPASDTTRKVMRERGIDLERHRSRVVDQDIVDRADLVLTMERRHARDLALAHGCGSRTHTCKGFAAWVSRRQFGPGPDGAPAPERDLAALLAEADTGRAPGALLGDDRPDEVMDPHGRSARVHRKTADELTAAVQAIAAALAAAQEQPA